MPGRRGLGLALQSGEASAKGRKPSVAPALAVPPQNLLKTRQSRESTLLQLPGPQDQQNQLQDLLGSPGAGCMLHWGSSPRACSGPHAPGDWCPYNRKDTNGSTFCWHTSLPAVPKAV